MAAHPVPEILAAFARRELPSSEQAAVADHVGGCATCRAAVARVPGIAPTPDPAPAALADHPRYKILCELGAGGMGVVYKAEHRLMGRLVALKVLAPHLTAKAGAVDRFRKEVRAAAQLNHPHIVTAHDADEAGGMHFLVMEYVEGTSLDRLVARRGPLPVPMACAFARQAALGLQHAHEKGMVHRDIKPQNLMVTKKAQVKVMDFGLARFARTDIEEEPAPAGRLPFGAGKTVADPHTNPHLLMGTPDYLSPEQAKNSHAVDARSDLYSLGCTLFFLLTGKPPFAHAASLIDKLLAHTEEPPAAIRGLRPDVPDGLAAVLAKLLAKNPADRFAMGGEAAAALLPFTRTPENHDKVAGFEVIDAVVIVPAPPGGQGSAVLPAALPAPAPVTPFDFDTAPASEGPTVETDRPRRSKRLRKAARAKPWWERPWVMAGLAAGALLLVVGAAIAMWPKRESPPAAPPPAGVGPSTPAPKGRPNPWQNGGKSEPLPLLYVVPSEGVYGPDYFPVVAGLRDRGVRVVTASGQGGTATLTQGDAPGKTVTADVKLADADAAKYSGVAFCGFNVSEYVVPGGSWGVARETRQLIADMQGKNKPVAAICVGQRVLAHHGVLKGKPAARSELVLNKFPGVNLGGMTWRDEGVVVAEYGAGGKIITAASPDDAAEFAAALSRAVQGE